MHTQFIIRLLSSDTEHAIARYAIVDCAATAGFEDDDEILTQLKQPDIEKHTLFTGENAWAIDHIAPYLLPLDSQPQLEQWLIENGWGNNWAVFFTSDAHIKILLAHFRKYFKLEAPNHRDTFFRFYAPSVMGDLLPMLSEQEALAFFGPIHRFVIESEQGRPAVFDRPKGELDEKIDPSATVFAKHKRLAKQWQTRLIDQHAAAYANLGFKVTAEAAANAITIEDNAGKSTRLQKTTAGIDITTGQQRKFRYELTTCKHPAAMVDPAGNRIEFDIVERDNEEKRNIVPMLTAIRMQDIEKTWVFDYDDMAYLERIDYPDCTSTKISHDGYGQLTEVTDRNGGTTRYDYNFNQLLTTFENPNGHTTRFDYTEHTAPSTITFADGATFNFEYTDTGAMKAFLAGNTLVAAYDVEQDDFSDDATWKVDYTEGGHAEFQIQNGKIVRAANSAGTVVLAYDEAGQLVKETFKNRSVTYHRNETGHLTGITTPLGRTIHYTLDGENRVSGIHAWTDRPIDIQYSPNGAMKSITYPNGMRLEQNTDAMGLPDRMRLAGSQSVLFDKAIQRDRASRVTRVSDCEQILAYHYDKEGRLLKAVSERPQESECFHIDANANRLADNLGRYDVNAADRIIGSGRNAFHYDRLGNLIQGTCPGGHAKFTFTDLNRLKSISLPRGRARYRYDAFGRRVAKKVNGITTRYFWAQSQILHEAQFDENNAPLAAIDYLYFPQTPVLLGIRHNRTIHWAAFGHRYETLCLTNQAGRPVWQARYDAFGQAHVQTGSDIHQPLRLPGQYFDPESGLHYNLARYYDPGQGRYLSPDPLFLQGGGTNFYTYCNGDPINRIDPFGESVSVANLIGSAVGGAVDAAAEDMCRPKADNKTDGFKPAQAALNGGAASAIGGTVVAVEDSPIVGAPTTAMAATTLPAMNKTGFLAGAGKSAAEQCAQLEMNKKGIDPLSAVKQALADGVSGAGATLPPLTAGTFSTRKLPEIDLQYQPALPAERTATQLPQKKQFQVTQPPEVMKKGLQKSDHSDKCTEGEPVNAITGEVTLAQTDFSLPGRLPLTWQRYYGSQSAYCGLLGPGWQSPADARLELDKDKMVIFHDGSPGGAVFGKLPTDAPVMEVGNGAELSATDDQYRVALKSGRTYHFSKSFTNDQSHVTLISDPSGNHLAFERQDGLLIRIRDNSGQRINITSQDNRITAMHLGDKLLTGFRYDVDGRLTAATDAAGGQKRFFYENGRLVRHMDKNKLSFYYAYDDSGRCIHSWGDNGLYDCRFDHRIYERRVIVTDSAGHAKTYFYNHARLPDKVEDHTGATVKYTYDDAGRVIAITDALERTTKYDYDAAGNITDIYRPDDNHVAFVYDDFHRPVQMLDDYGRIWEQQFDPQGRLIEKISPLDERTRYSYNRHGDLEAITDPEGRTTAFEYDDRGLVIAVIEAGKHPTRYQRDLLGNITAVIDPAGRTTRYVYDDKSRLVEAIQPSGLSQRLEWDGEDNLISHTDPNDLQTRFEYGGLNEIVRRINADGTSVRYQYDTEERLIGVTNEKGQTHRFQYDPAGRVISQTDYYGHTTGYTYNPAGQLIQSIDPLQRTIAYEYDQAGRLFSKTFESEEQEIFQWDATGNLVGIDSPGPEAQWLYDGAGHLVAEQNGQFIIEYQYDKSGRRTSRFTSYGNLVRYSYNDQGDLCAIQINDNEPVVIERDDLGRITKERFSKHLQRTTRYDEDNRLSGRTIESDLTSIERTYGYDTSGNLIAKHDNAKGPWHYTCDPMGRITEARAPEYRAQRYAFDPAGDLLEHLPDTGHGLRRARHNHTDYHFDAAGNLTERRNHKELTRYYWNEQNRLIAVRKADDTSIDMFYDALGRRRIKMVNGERTYYHYDGDALLCEQFEDEMPKEFVYLPGTFEPFALIEDGNVYYYNNDVNGLPLELVKYNGQIVWSATYDAMGRVDKILVDEVEQPLRMQGQYFDKELGLCYNRHRYYDPQTCSFTSQDPLGLSAGENLYAYAPNVWQWIDPLGLLYQGSYVPYSAVTKVAKPGLLTKMAGRIGSKFLGPVGVAVGVAEVSYLAGKGIGAIMYPSQMVPYETPENLEVTSYVDTDDWIGIRNGKFYTSTGKQVTAGDFADWLTRLNRRDNSFGNKCNSALSGGPTANHNQYKAGGGDNAEPEIVPPISTDEQVVYDAEEGYVTTSGRKVTAQQYYDWRNRKFDAEFNNGPKTTPETKPKPKPGPPATQEVKDAAVKDMMDRFGMPEEQARTIVDGAMGRGSDVVVGGSRVRGNARPDSDLDLGYNGLSTNQAKKVNSKARKVGEATEGGLPIDPDHPRIVPGNKTKNIDEIQSAEEFFQRSGMRKPPDARAGEAYKPSGSISYKTDGSIIQTSPNGEKTIIKKPDK